MKAVTIAVKADIRSIIEVMSARIETIIVVTRTTIIMQRETFLRSFAPSKSSQLTAWPMMSPLQRTLLDEFSRGATPTWPNTYLQCNVTIQVLLSSFCNLVSPIFPLPSPFPLLLCRFLSLSLHLFSPTRPFHARLSLSPTRKNGREPLGGCTPDESLLEHHVARIRKRQDSPTWAAPSKVYLSVCFQVSSSH